MSTPKLDQASRATHGRHNSRYVGMIECVDGFTVSVVSGAGTYCTPKPALCAPWVANGCPASPLGHEVACTYDGPFTSVEVGFPSHRPEPWSDWKDYCETPEDPTGTVYGQVPVQVVRDLLELHGGETLYDHQIEESDWRIR